MAPIKGLIPLGIAIAALVVSGCGSGPATTARSSSTEPAGAATPSVANVTSSPAVGPVIAVTVVAGTVTPTNAQAQASVGQPITLEVNSDAADSIHVHSIPEHVFDVQPKAGQRFEFTVGIPGNVDVELHNLHRTIVTIAVRP